jgi:hypothetical protein
MKKLMLIISTEILVCCNTAQVQNKSQNILESKNISEIEEFLKTAHPDDPKEAY